MRFATELEYGFLNIFIIINTHELELKKKIEDITYVLGKTTENSANCKWVRSKYSMYAHVQDGALPVHMTDDRQDIHSLTEQHGAQVLSDYFHVVNTVCLQFTSTVTVCHPHCTAILRMSSVWTEVGGARVLSDRLSPSASSVHLVSDNSGDDNSFVEKENDDWCRSRRRFDRRMKCEL